MAVDPARVWKALLEPTLDEIFDMPKGGKGTAANIWGDVFIQNEALHDKMKKDGARRLPEDSAARVQLVERQLAKEAQRRLPVT